MALLATPGESEERRKQAAWGRLSFGYFSLAEQRKVSRLRGRDPDSNKPSRERLFFQNCHPWLLDPGNPYRDDVSNTYLCITTSGAWKRGKTPAQQKKH